MASQVEEDVYAIGANLCCQITWCQMRNAMPVCKVLFHPCVSRIFDDVRVVRMHDQAWFLTQRLEYRLQKIGKGMVIKISGYKTNL